MIINVNVIQSLKTFFLSFKMFDKYFLFINENYLGKEKQWIERLSSDSNFMNHLMIMMMIKKN